MRGDLADDEDRDPVQGVEPAADRGAEQQSGGEPVGAGPPCEHAEENRGDGPDADVEDERDAGAVRELVEREPVVDARPGRAWTTGRAR